MCMSRPSPPKPVVQAQAAPITNASERPEFDTELAEMDTQSTTAMKKKSGKDKLKIAKNPAVAMNVGTGGGASSGVNIV